MYCSHCEHQNPDNSIFCTSCGARLAPASEVPQSAQYPWIGLLIIAGGAIMMLISMALDWYIVRDSSPTISNLDFFGLLTERYSDLNYAGTGLPLLIIIVFSAIVLISVLHSFASGIILKNLWIWLGSLCLALLAGNYLYILVKMLYRNTGYYVVPYAGWIVTFIGAIAIIIGSSYVSRTVSQSNPVCVMPIQDS